MYELVRQQNDTLKSWCTLAPHQPVHANTWQMGGTL